jgi:hypothetical protein
MRAAIVAAPLNSWDGVNVIERGLGSLLLAGPPPADRRLLDHCKYVVTAYRAL